MTRYWELLTEGPSEEEVRSVEIADILEQLNTIRIENAFIKKLIEELKEEEEIDE